MTNSTVYSQFTQAAIACHLSGRQMQLWMSLYEIIAADCRQDIILCTSLLLKQLQLSRRQFYRVRQALVEAGFLSTRLTDKQKTSYTLLLHNRQVAVASVLEEDAPTQQNQANCEPPAVAAVAATESQHSEQNAASLVHETDTPQQTGTQTAQKNYLPDGIAICHLNKQDYQASIEDFCQPYHNAVMLRHALLQWADMRLKNGWTLTLRGIEILLENLQELGANNIAAMEQIVKQSLDRRWRGFFPYKQISRPSGKLLRKLEEKERREEERRTKHLPACTKKFHSSDEDLSFLEI